jgi:flavin reductase (DIM6/NTAB) family NADH-FMN oxidoreductase RutF
MDIKTMNKLSYGLFVLTARDGEKDNGCIINTTMQVTAEPNQIAIAVNKSNLTHDMILKTNKFTASIISQDASMDLFKHFGFVSGRDVDKFKDYTQCKRGYNDLYYITEGTNGYISAWVTNTVDLGTHTLFIGTVTDMEVLSDIPSATYAYYHAHIKTQPAKQTADNDGKTKYRCTICGYEYEGEELPADFICPLCKHPASDFEKVM